MILDKLVLTDGTVFEGYIVNEDVPENEVFIAICKPEIDSYTRYININHIIYVEIKSGKIEKAYEAFNTNYTKAIDKFIEM